MDARETTKLVNAIERILDDVNDNTKRAVAIGQYLYQENEKKLLIPQSLWNIIICLDKELAEREFGKMVSLDYQPKVFDHSVDCTFLHKCEQCWTEEKLAFVVDGNMCDKIAHKPQERISCGGAGVRNPAYQFCAVCLRQCIYRYMTSSECYIPDEFYRWEMFVFFLYSFDAFYICFKRCIETENQSLKVVFEDVLRLVFKYQGVSDEELAKELQEDSLDGARFIKVIFNNCKAMDMAGYSELNSTLVHFMMAMKKKREEIVLFLRNNEVKAGKILESDLLKVMLTDLEKGWLEGIGRVFKNIDTQAAR
ncbi:MAG: hypothetical protein K2J99_09105 [Lachnospiraceae bacterium]|nr:hypothetical protein [Lachnospiraceae bacterium]